MSEMAAEADADAAAAATAAEPAARRESHPLVRAAWQSGLLGVTIGMLPFLGDLLADGRSGGALAAGLAQGLVWAVVICMALAVGVRRAAKLSILGLVIAPVAALLGEAMHEAVEQMLVSDEGIRVPAAVLALVRGVEYGVFGLLLGRVRRRPTRTWASVGGLVGAVFGAAILVAWQVAGPLSTPDLVAQGVNELIFPAGCALVLKDVYSPRAGAPL